jgi:hypothetical protein
VDHLLGPEGGALLEGIGNKLEKTVLKNGIHDKADGLMKGGVSAAEGNGFSGAFEKTLMSDVTSQLPGPLTDPIGYAAGKITGKANSFIDKMGGKAVSAAKSALSKCIPATLAATCGADIKKVVSAEADHFLKAEVGKITGKIKTAEKGFVTGAISGALHRIENHLPSSAQAIVHSAMHLEAQVGSAIRGSGGGGGGATGSVQLGASKAPKDQCNLKMDHAMRYAGDFMEN